jgi:hypothetical protein
MEKEKRINVTLDHGEPVFFSDNVTVSHNLSKFIIDFSQTTPRFDNVGGDMQQSLVIKHRSIMIEPQFAKIIMELLEKNVKKYEKSFGKIKVPKGAAPESKTVDLMEPEKASEKATRYIG